MMIVIVAIVVMIIVVVMVVVVVIFTQFDTAAPTDAGQLAPAIITGTAVGPPTMAAPIARFEIPSITPVVVVNVTVTPVMVFPDNGTGGDCSQSTDKREDTEETHVFSLAGKIFIRSTCVFICDRLNDYIN